MSDPIYLVVILARAGSKGLPNKALAAVLEKPLVAWSIEHAHRAQNAKGIVLSSDGEDILDVGRQYGIEVCKRPAELATDHAPIDAAARHAVASWESQRTCLVDCVAILYGNVAFRPLDLIDRSFAKVIETGADSVQSVYQVGTMHPYWLKRLGGAAGDVLQMYEPNNIYRRQDLPPVYKLDGGIICVTRKSLFNFDPSGGEPHRFLGTDRRAIITQPGDVIEVDDAQDLAIAQALAARKMAIQRESTCRLAS